MEDDEAESDDERKRATILVAASFTEFLGSLRNLDRGESWEVAIPVLRSDDPMTVLKWLRAKVITGPTGVVQVVGLGSNMLLRDADLECLTHLPGLVYVILQGTKVGNAGLVHIGRLGGLKVLNLDGCRNVTSEGFWALGGIANLRSLWIRDTALSDSDLAALSGLPNLTRLEIGRTEVSDDGMKYLKRMPGLKALGLSRTRVSDAGLADIGQISNLEELEINDTPVTDDGLRHLLNLTKLKVLGVAGTGVSDISPARLRQLLPNSKL